MSSAFPSADAALPAVEVAPSIVARGVRKSYVGGDGTRLQVLDGVDLEVRPGEMVSVIGQSGSGKSTLLHVLGALDHADAGEVFVGGRKIASLREEALAELRSRNVGFVFQFHHLLREFTALENVMMPQLIAGTAEGDARRRAEELLGQIGLAARATHKPAQLSGGEQQRVAVARALANRPLALLADEPSGNLDPETSEKLHDMLFAVCREEGAAMVLVTHDLGLAARADRVLRLHGGQLVSAGPEVSGPAQAGE
ncbi:MAG TPA: ABC transporter ATP-binding protein [Longimicrobium sp.]|jgi:lipoprotein-releasing system ATP-binding protein|uniref:ABC transporter ATP-binding protein n=1 Tax=Longimicrobium sp. TaxID=2029185 RepID=UPI002EDBB2C7